MKINTQTLSSLTPGELFDVILPCQATPNFFQLVMTAAKKIEENDGKIPIGEGNFVPFLSELANDAAHSLDPSQLATELAMLRAHGMPQDVREEMALRLISYQTLNVTDALLVILKSTYMAMLHKVLFSLERS